MAYVDRDELDAKPKTNDCDIDLASAAAHDLTSATFWRQSAEEPCKTAAPPVKSRGPEASRGGGKASQGSTSQEAS
jgi:hypothetical protein